MKWRCPIRSDRFPRSSHGRPHNLERRLPLGKIDRNEMIFYIGFWRVVLIRVFKCIFMMVYFFYFFDIDRYSRTLKYVSARGTVQGLANLGQLLSKASSLADGQEANVMTSCMSADQKNRVHIVAILKVAEKCDVIFHEA